MLPPPTTAPRPFHFPAFTEDLLDNGLRVLVCAQARISRVTVAVALNTGLTQEEQKFPGLADLTAAMLREGTRTRSDDELAEAIDRLGGHYSAVGDQDHSRVSLSSLAEYAGHAIDLIGDLVLEPAFPDAQFERLRRQEQSELAHRNTQPGYLARKVFGRRLFGEHPYAFIDPTPQSLDALQPAHLAAFHQTRYRPEGAAVIAVGDVTRDDVLRAVEKRFGRWPVAASAERASPALPSLGERRLFVLDLPAASQSNIVLGNFGPAYGSDDHVPAVVMNQVLGGSYASRLFMNLREAKGYTYGAYSQLDARAQGGAFAAWAAVGTEVTAAAVGEFLAEFSRIRNEPVPEPELSSAISYLTGVFPLALETTERIAGHLATLVLHRLPRDYWDTYRERIAAVNAGAVAAIAQRYVCPDAAVIVVVGAAEKILRGLSGFGPVTVVDADGNPRSGG